MRNLLKLIIYKLIEFVEYIEYRNMNLDECDISKKFIDELHTDRYQVLSDTGYVDISSLSITQPYTHYEVLLNNGLNITCADTHMLFDENMKIKFVEDIILGDLIQTKYGLSKVSKLEKKRHRTSMGDLSVMDSNMRYYTNGILSHNTICSSIMLLHFVLFNNNKNALVTANKLDTAVEVLDKIREIYQRLPFFLQSGIVNWSMKTIVFENKSRIKGFATTKTASIGQAADFLYLDEFAYLPDTIAEKFYKSVFPTVSSMENSKIIITSTPNGYNLFHKLLMDAEKPEGEKSNYMPNRVYWWQVEKRHVTYIRLNKSKLSDSGITKEEVLEFMVNKYTDTKCELAWNDEISKWVVHVLNKPSCTEEMILNDVIKGIKVPVLGDVTTWKKETIKDIGGEEAFNQEFDLRFINTSRSLLDETLIRDLRENAEEYTYQPIDEIEERLRFDLSDLVWNINPKTYEHEKRKKYKIIISVDISEGLGQDSSIINMFKVAPKPVELINRDGFKYKSIGDFYQLEQIGLFKNNLVSVSELSELLYLICFEHFDPDNVKVVVELNNYGNELLAHMPHLFDGHNNYGSSIFFRYKHRIDSHDEKLGLKVGANKNLLVKDYQERMASRSIKVTNLETITEMTTFIKHTTNAGNIVYRADGSQHDDQVMTIVNMSSVFEKTEFKQIIEDYHYEDTPTDIKRVIDEVMDKIEYNDPVDYTQLLDVRRRKMGIGNKSKMARKEWGL